MTPSPHPPALLYPRLLGPAWNELARSIRELHTVDTPMHASGAFRIRHGTGRTARVLVRLLRMPPAAERVSTRLVVVADERAQRWSRDFDGRPLRSAQLGRADGVLRERFGPLELRFRLRVAAGALHYHPDGVGLGLGCVFVPLPRSLGPRIAATERADVGEHQVHVSVTVALPWVGELLSYEGLVSTEEGRASWRP